MRKVKVGITGIFLLVSGLLMAQNMNRTPQGVKVNVAEGNFNAEVIFLFSFYCPHSEVSFGKGSDAGQRKSFRNIGAGTN